MKLALCLALAAGTASAQTVQPEPFPQPAPERPAFKIQVVPRSPLQAQSVAPAMSCPGGDLVECAQTDAQRRMVLMSYTGQSLTDPQMLRLIADLGDVQSLDNAGNDTPLSWAIAVGRPAAVAALLDKGADPLATNLRGELLLNRIIDNAAGSSAGLRPEVFEGLRLALERAAQKKRLPPRPPLDASLALRGDKTDMALLRLLVRHGADPAAKGKYGGAAFDLAISYALPEAVRILAAAKPGMPQAYLDARAYEALADRKPALLEAMRAGGADPARHARNDPLALFDALRPERGAEVLELVLKTGADPNAPKPDGLRAPPLFEARFDPDKIRLLLKHGADPNTRDSSRYSLLALLLFNPNREIAVPSAPVPGRETRRYPKVELVRLLLDHGAQVNGDHGGRGRSGALGLARREDKDVIALLVERGATLTAPVLTAKELEVSRAMGYSGKPAGGPLTLAVEMERDDLALALLARDRSVAPQDRLALPLAAQRGAVELVAALLKAGADPNAADEKGATAWAIAERRRDAAMLKSLADAGAQRPAQAAKPRAERDYGGEFENAAAKEIDDVVFFDPPRFAIGSLDKAVFGFYGKELNQFEQVKCERAAGFGIIAMANMAGAVRAGICTAEARRVRELAAASKPALESLLAQLSQGGGFKADSAQLKRLGWTYAISQGPQGAEVHYFALIAVGHGILSLPTVVLVPKGARQAVVVQADTMRLCGDGYGMDKQTPLCTDTKEALTEIARRLQARFGGTP